MMNDDRTALHDSQHGRQTDCQSVTHNNRTFPPQQTLQLNVIATNHLLVAKPHKKHCIYLGQ